MFFNHYDLEKMVPEDHVLRRIKEKFPAREVAEKREEWKQCLGREGYGMETGLKALFLQFWGDYSDRELEEHLRDNMAYRWFCGFTLESKTPDHTYFCRVRKALGERWISELFHRITEDAAMRKLIKKLGSFVDASAIRRKEAEWKKRDEEREKEERGSANSAMNVGKFSADREARWGCKGGKKFWFGYKRHVSVDMGSGLIEKIYTTPANTHDAEPFQHLCPVGKTVYADRAYDNGNVRRILADRQCKDGVMRLKHRRDFNKRRNKRLSKLRAPWEHVFSKMSKRTRYMGLAKTSLQVLMEAIVHNIKRLIVLEGPYIPVMGTA